MVERLKGEIMDKDVTDKVSAILGFIQAGVEKTSDFAVEQIPIVAKEILQYGFIHSIVCGLIALAIGVVVMKLFLRFLAWLKKEGDLSDGAPFSLFLLLPALVCLCIAYSFFDDAVKIKFAPRVYLIEYVSNLSKSK